MLAQSFSSRKMQLLARLPRDFSRVS